MNKLFPVSKCLACSILLFSLSNAVVAQTDVSVMGEQKDLQTDTEPSGMLNIESDVAGYQPLAVAGEQIDAAYMEETYGQRYGAVVLFHDLGKQYETRDVITPLRHALPNYGWSTLTLTLDLPVNANVLLSTKLEQNDEQQVDTGTEQSADETSMPAVSNEQRIQAALAFLEAKGIKRILFLGHGDGGKVAIDTVSKSLLPISGLILVNTSETVEQLTEGLRIPILDIYGSNALAGTETAVKKRALQMKRNKNTAYVSRKVIGANHVFYGLDTMLSQHLRGWLKKSYQKGSQ